MQNTFSQSGNDSKWFLKKSFFKIGMWHSRPPRDPPPFMANAILNFHFDFLHPSLIKSHKSSTILPKNTTILKACLEWGRENICSPSPFFAAGEVAWGLTFVRSSPGDLDFCMKLEFWRWHNDWAWLFKKALWQKGKKPPWQIYMLNVEKFSFLNQFL